MTAFLLYRMIAQVLAPLRASTGEGAQATVLGQDKRDSLWACPAVGLSWRFNAFKQAALLERSLSFSTCVCKALPIFTSSAFRHVSRR